MSRPRQDDGCAAGRWVRAGGRMDRLCKTAAFGSPVRHQANSLSQISANFLRITPRCFANRPVAARYQSRYRSWLNSRYRSTRPQIGGALDNIDPERHSKFWDGTPITLRGNIVRQSGCVFLSPTQGESAIEHSKHLFEPSRLVGRRNGAWPRYCARGCGKAHGGRIVVAHRRMARHSPWTCRSEAGHDSRTDSGR